MSKARKGRRGGWIVMGLALLGLGVLGYGAGPGGWFAAEAEAALEGAPVRRGPLRISEVVRGNLEARNSISLRSEIDRDATILYLAPQGPIEAGTLVAELDVAEMEDRRLVQEIDLKKAEADYVKAREQYEIQVIQNQTDVAEAELALELARLDLEKYLADEGEWEHELSQAEEAIALAEEELKRAEEELRWTRELAAKGFAQKNEVEQDELVEQRRRIELKQAVRERDLMLEYGHRRRTSELEADVASRERDVQKTQKQAVARLADYESEREAAKYRLAREEEKLAKLMEQLSKAKVFAPEAGILVHGRRQSRWGPGEPVQEGGEVYRGQEIASIPRSGGMVATASLHETKLQKVAAGQRCLIQIDALPGRMFDGRVDSVAILPQTGGWMTDPNQRLYPAEIAILGALEEMRPGMSCSIEILIADLPEVLYVPRQCVYLDGAATVCFVRRPQGVDKRAVEVGQENNKWVEIRSGLAEGEVVLLAPPPSFEPSRIQTRDGEELPGWDPGAGGGERPQGERGERPTAEGGEGEGRSEDETGDAAGEGEGEGEGGDREAMRERWQQMSTEERAAAMKTFQQDGARPGGGESRGGGGGEGGGRGRGGPGGRGQP